MRTKFKNHHPFSSQYFNNKTTKYTACESEKDMI